MKLFSELKKVLRDPESVKKKPNTHVQACAPDCKCVRRKHCANAVLALGLAVNPKLAGFVSFPLKDRRGPCRSGPGSPGHRCPGFCRTGTGQSPAAALPEVPVQSRLAGGHVDHAHPSGTRPRVLQGFVTISRVAPRSHGCTSQWGTRVTTVLD